MVFYSDADDDTEAETVCLDCLLDDADEDLCRGLEFARKYGHADFDPIECAWFTPEDRAFPGELGWDAVLEEGE